MKSKRLYILIMIWLFLIPAVALVVMAFLAPILQGTLGYPHGEELYALLSNLCHQYPTRSFWVHDHPAGLCARCVGGYSGVAVAAMLALWHSQTVRFCTAYRFRLGLLLLAPGVGDGLVQLLTAYESTNIVRVLTGLTGGAGIFLLCLPGPLRWKFVEREALTCQ